MQDQDRQHINIIILKAFPKIWIDYHRGISGSLFSHFLFSCIFFPIFPSHSLFFLIWSIGLVLGLPLSRFLSVFVCSISLGTRITCQNHLNLLFWMLFLISSTPSANLMLVFLILFLFCLNLLSKFHFHGLNIGILCFCCSVFCSIQ